MQMQKKATEAILVSDKKKGCNKRQGDHITIKGSVQQADVTLLRIYARNRGEPKDTKQLFTDIKGEVDSNPVIVREFNTSLTSMNRSPRLKINKETLAFNDT